MAKVRFEGTEVAISDEIAKDDAKLRAALVTAWPSFSTADLKRTTEDGTLVVTAAKRAGAKGAPPAVAAALRDAKECLNPAIALAGEIKIADARGSLDARDLLRLRGRIRDAIAAGDRDVQAVRAVAHELRRLGAVPSLHVPAGF